MKSRTKKILIIDDEADFTEMLNIRLRSEGYEVTTATDGLSGLEKAKRTRPDLILLDVLMPQLDGWEVCRRLNADPETQKIPVVMMTALPPLERDKSALQAGAKWIIVKPFDEEALLKTVKSAIPS